MQMDLTPECSIASLKKSLCSRLRVAKEKLVLLHRNRSVGPASPSRVCTMGSRSCISFALLSCYSDPRYAHGRIPKTRREKRMMWVARLFLLPTPERSGVRLPPPTRPPLSFVRCLAIRPGIRLA